MPGFTAWDPVAPLSSPQPVGNLSGFVDDRFCVPQTADEAAVGGFVGQPGPAGEVEQSGMSGVIPMIGFTEWDALAAPSVAGYPRQDLRLSGQLTGPHAGPGSYTDVIDHSQRLQRLEASEGGRLGTYEDMDFCRPMPYEDPPSGLAGLDGCCWSCDRDGPCVTGNAAAAQAGVDAAGLGGITDFLPRWLTNPQGIEEWGLLAGLGLLTWLVVTPLVFGTKARSKGRRQALRRSRLKAKARRAQIAVEYA